MWHATVWERNVTDAPREVSTVKLHPEICRGLFLIFRYCVPITDMH
jgi:hypothetical protein